MADIDELMALRPQVSQLRHDLEVERRRHGITRDERDAYKAIMDSQSAQIAAIRAAHHDHETPPMGVAPKPHTTAITRRNREHG